MICDCVKLGPLGIVKLSLLENKWRETGFAKGQLQELLRYLFHLLSISNM